MTASLHGAPSALTGLQAAGLERGSGFTAWALLAALSLASLESASGPIFGLPLHRTVLNHLPLVLLLPVLLVHLGGQAVFRAPVRWSPVLGLSGPLLALALYALVGSLTALWVLDRRDTYLSFGVYLLLLPLCIAAAPDDLGAARRWAGALIGLWLLTSLAALAGAALRVDEDEGVLHEIEYLVGTGFFAAFYATSMRWLRLVLLLMLAAAALLNHKLTGYAITIMALLHFALYAGWRRLPAHWRRAYAIGAAGTTLAACAVLAGLYFEFRDVLPSGNVDVRAVQYEAALRQFLDSPIWGQAYMGESGQPYLEGGRFLNIPTHSDLLDMLRQGGLIALLLFLWGYGRILRIIHRAATLTAGQGVLHAYFVGACFFQATALVTFAINPLLLKGPFLVVIWGHLGLAVGLARAVTRQASPP